MPTHKHITRGGTELTILSQEGDLILAEGPLAQYHLALTTAVVTDPDVAEAIVQTAEQGKVDFIAMATHGRGGVQHWALGSITERVLHTTRVPLFIVRPQGA